ITTVGYGEITPRSFLGRLITLPILVCGLLLITLPSFVLGREFSHVWEKMTMGRGAEVGAEGGGGGEGEQGQGAHPYGHHPNDNVSLYSPVFSARRLREQVQHQYPQYPTSDQYPQYPSQLPRTPATGTGVGVGTTTATGRDLSNMKLAQNQTELSRQIEELAAAMEVQGRLLRRLMERVEGVGVKEEGKRDYVS
ncbi:hypothetical protein CVT25_001736, partial [Psilocybe cyanescens]